MAYYLLNKTSTTNITSATLYELKRVNTIVDKPSGSNKDIRMGSRGSNTSGSHLGPGLNPWQSYNLNIGSSDANAGLMGFNSPFNTSAQSAMSYLRSYDWKYNPNTWGSSTQTGWYGDEGPGVDLFPEVRSPGYNHGKYSSIIFYAIDSPGNGMSLGNMNFLTGQITTESGTAKYRLATGTVTTGGGDVQSVGTGASASFDSSHGMFAPANIGQGEGTPYNESSELGSSTAFIMHYRNNSSQMKARIITVNTNYSSSPTISLGSEQTLTNYGSPVYAHGAINMGKGTVWAGFHRGANYQRIQYGNWNSGTTFSTLNSLLVTSRSSTNTLFQGWLVKLTDEQALWFFTRRSGASSGNARVIAATALEASGSAKIPVVRGSTELRTYDIGGTYTQACSAAVGSSDTAGTVYGIVAWAETSSGNNSLNVMSWKYVISTNSLTFETSNIYTADESYTGTNTYRAHIGIKCLGFNSDENANYYELAISQGETSGGGARFVTLKQDARDTSNGGLTETGTVAPGNNGIPSTSAYITQQSFLNYSTGRQWFLDSVPNGYSGKTWSMYGYRTDGGSWSVKTLSWNINTP